MSREAEVQLLVDKIMSTTMIYDHGGDSTASMDCPLCGAYYTIGYAEDYGDSPADKKMFGQQIDHDLDCPYLIAKGLSTNIVKTIKTEKE